jgi:hypothetical protein
MTSHSFIAYIDESGDDGLTGNYRTPGKSGGSSHWLNIGAVVWRNSRDLDAVKWAKTIISRLPKKARPLHFSELRHHERVMAIAELSKKPFRISCVMANKPIIPVGIYQDKNQLYHYMTRYLIERISWLCRDMRPKVPEGDGKVRIIFSRRGGMSYDDFRSYMHSLKDKENSDIRIYWPVIDIEGIKAFDQSQVYGLQVADLAVSALSAAIEPDIYGNCEMRFATMLKSNVYCREGKYLGYGIKTVPSPEKITLNNQQENFISLFR